MGYRFFLKTNKVKQFDYKPLYFDEKKEALDDLVERVKLEEEGKIPSKHEIRFNRKHGMVKSDNSANMRIAILIALLSIIAYLILR